MARHARWGWWWRGSRAVWGWEGWHGGGSGSERESWPPRRLHFACQLFPLRKSLSLMNKLSLRHLSCLDVLLSPGLTLGLQVEDQVVSAPGLVITIITNESWVARDQDWVTPDSRGGGSRIAPQPENWYIFILSWQRYQFWLNLIMTFPSRHVSVILSLQFVFYCRINISGKLWHSVTDFRNSHTIFTESIMHCIRRNYWFWADMAFSTHHFLVAPLFWLSQLEMWPESLFISDWAERHGAWRRGEGRQQSQLLAGALLHFGRTLTLTH